MALLALILCVKLLIYYCCWNAGWLQLSESLAVVDKVASDLVESVVKKELDG